MYQEAERVQWDEWVTHGSVKLHPPVEAAKIRQQVPRERRSHSRFACRKKKKRQSGGPRWNPLPVKAKARLVIRGQHCPDNAQGFVRTDAPTAVSVFFDWSRQWDGVGVSAVWMCRVPFLPGKHREVGEPLFFEPLSRGLPGIEKGALKGFRIARFSPGMVERTA